MDDFVRTLFDNLILMERLAKKMYVKMANSAKSKVLRDVFVKIASEEANHEVLFKKMSLEEVKLDNKKPLKSLVAIKDVERRFLSQGDIKDIKKAIDFAISEEEKACANCDKIAKHLNYSEAKQLLIEVAKQELKHKALLEKVKLELEG